MSEVADMKEMGGEECTRHNQQERCRAERRDEPAFINLGRLLNPRFDETGLRIYVCRSADVARTRVDECG